MADFTDEGGVARGLTTELEQRLAALKAQADALTSDLNRARTAARYGEGPTKRADERAVRRGAGEAAGDSDMLAREAKGRKQAATATDEYNARLVRAREFNSQLTRAESAQRGELARDIQTRNLASQAMHRHGALTTEFIQSAARGSTTLAELRYQAGATITKFGGWVLAGAAVYGAANAIQHLGEGALSTFNGVNSLQRVVNHLDTGKAQQQFRDLAEHTNLPISTVGEAFFESAKVFNDQADAAKLTKTALEATKIAELSTADSVRFLTSIVRGFGLEAGDSKTILDQLNAAQNNFGVSIRDTAAGTAKAAGQFRAAGGTVSELIALIATGQRVSGRTGEELGTAFGRSAEIVRRQPKRRQELRNFGIDPDQNINAIYEQAIALVENKQVRGNKITKLATALSTPQLSGRITPILQNANLFRQIQSQTSPEAAKGSSDRELRIALNSVKERVSAIGVELSRLGSALAQSGALDVFGLFIEGLTDVLRLATSIIEVFNLLPKPLREGALIALELVAALKLIRRFNPGELGGDRSGVRGFLTQTPDQQLRRFGREGQHRAVEYFQDERERTAIRAASARQQSIYANQAAQATYGQFGSRAAGGDQGALGKISRAQDRAVRAQEAVEQADLEQESAKRSLTQTIKERNDFERQVIHGRMTPVEFYSRRGQSFIPPTFEQPTQAGPLGVDKRGISKNQMVLPGMGAKALAEEEQKITAASATQRQWLQKLGYSGKAFDAALTKGKGAAAALPGALRSGAGKMKGFASELNNTLGPMDLFLIGAVATYEIISQFQDALDEDTRRAAQLQRDPKTSADRAKQRQQLKADAKRGRSFGEFLTNVSSNTLNFLDPSNIGDLDKMFSFTDEADARKSRDKKDLEEANRVARQRRLGVRSGGKTGIPQALPEDILKATQANLANFNSGAISAAEFSKRMDRIISASFQGGGDQAKQQQGRSAARLQRVTALAGRGGSQVFGDLVGVLDKDLDSHLKDLETLFGTGQSTGRDITDFSTTAVERLRRLELRAGTRKARGETIQSAVDGVMKRASDNLDKDLAGAITGPEQDRAYARYFSATRRGLNIPAQRRKAQSYIKSQQRQNNAQIEELTKQREGLFAQSVIGEKPKDTLERVTQIDRLGDRIKKALARRKDLGKQADQFDKALNDLQKAQDEARKQADLEKRRQQFQSHSQRTQGIADVRASETNDSRRKIKDSLDAANKILAEALATFPADSDEVRQARIKRNDLIASLTADAVTSIEADTALAESRQTSQAGKLRAQIEGARRKLGTLRGGHADVDEIKNALADLNNLERQLSDQIRQDATDLADSQFDLRLSKTGDPVSRANLEVERAKRELALTPKGTDPESRAKRNQALAKLNQAQNDKLKTRFSEQFNSIEFLADIGKITPEAELDRINRVIARIPDKLLKTVEGLRDFKRDLQKRAAALRKEIEGDTSSFELNATNLKLPTLYEIRRLATARKAGQDIRQTNNTTVNVEVNDPNAAGAVYDAIDRASSTSVRSAARAAGVL